MKYVFFGSPRFARILLENLPKEALPMAVVTNPDRPAGRRQVLTPPPVKSFLNENDVVMEILQPERPIGAAERLRALAPDAFVVAAYGMIIPKEVLAIPRLGTIGVHPSLLPHHRGASPIQSTILEGDETTGVTLYLMDQEVDHGPILSVATTPVDSMDYLQLESALATLGAHLLADTLPKFIAGTLEPRTQDESQATFTKKFMTEDGFVPWDTLAAAVRGTDPGGATEIWRRIRALNPEPGAWTEREGLRIKLLEASAENGALQLRRIQKAGKTPETISAGSLP